MQQDTPSEIVNAAVGVGDAFFLLLGIVLLPLLIFIVIRLSKGVYGIIIDAVRLKKRNDHRRKLSLPPLKYLDL